VDSEALISSIGDERAHQLGFRYWAYSAWTGAPRERLWSTHNVPPDLWQAYLDLLRCAVHLRPMLWDLNQWPGEASSAVAPNDPLLALLRRHDIACGLQLPLYDQGGLVATLVLASCGVLLGNRGCQVVFQQGLCMLAELHALCLPQLPELPGGGHHRGDHADGTICRRPTVAVAASLV
jgi:hypothetical protein